MTPPFDYAICLEYNSQGSQVLPNDKVAADKMFRCTTPQLPAAASPPAPLLSPCLSETDVDHTHQRTGA